MKSEVKREAKVLLSSEWQKVWDKVSKDETLKVLKPDVGFKMGSWNNNRAEEVIFHRLRLGIGVSLNSYLHKINKHPNDLCSHCYVPDTVSHFLLQCKKFEPQRANLIKKLGEESRKYIDIKTLLSGSNPPFKEVIGFVKECKVEI
jgi:hypothetical protein